MEFCAASVQRDIFDELVLWEDHIGRIVEVVRKDDFETLTAVMENVVRPLLTLKPLSWDDSRIRMRTTRSGLPIMALCDPKGQEKIVVAVGPAPRAHDATHPFHESGGAIQLAVAADGRKWAFHLSVPAGGVREREFCSFDIVSDPVEDAVSALKRYLAPDEVASGRALRAAREAYRRKRFPLEAPRIWQQVVREGALLERFQRILKEVVGLPVDEEAQSFARQQLDAIQWPPDPPSPEPEPAVRLNDRVWVCRDGSDRINRHRVMDPATLLKGDDSKLDKRRRVTPGSALGRALLGAREGDVRKVVRKVKQDGVETSMRILIVRPHASGIAPTPPAAGEDGASADS